MSKVPTTPQAAQPVAVPAEAPTPTPALSFVRQTLGKRADGTTVVQISEEADGSLKFLAARKAGEPPVDVTLTLEEQLATREVLDKLRQFPGLRARLFGELSADELAYLGQAIDHAGSPSDPTA